MSEPVEAAHSRGATVDRSHRPRQLTTEIRAAGLDVFDLVSVDGTAALMSDLPERLQDRRHAEIVFDTARALERVPELLGVGPHFVATAQRPHNTP